MSFSHAMKMFATYSSGIIQSISIVQGCSTKDLIQFTTFYLGHQEKEFKANPLCVTSTEQQIIHNNESKEYTWMKFLTLLAFPSCQTHPDTRHSTVHSLKMPVLYSSVPMMMMVLF